jgi:hypothetical protein
MDELGVAIVGYHGDHYHGQKKVLDLGLIYHGLVVKLLQILTFLASASPVQFTVQTIRREFPIYRAYK